MIKRLSFLTLLIVNCSLFSNDFNSIFNDAVKNYQEKRYDKALKIFLDLKSKGFDNFNINYNIGATYFKLKKYGQSRFYFERALFFKPFDKDVFNNLKIIYGKVLKDSILGEQEIMNKRIIFFIPFKILVLFFVIFFILTLFFVILLFMRYKKAIFVLFIIFAFFTGILTFLFFVQYSDYTKKVFVTIKDHVDVRIAPSKDETVIFTLSEGAKGTIIESTVDFFKINLADGTSGWINSEETINNF